MFHTSDNIEFRVANREIMTLMRKQYNFWPSKIGLDAWDVDRLIELSKDFPITEILIDEIKEIDTVYWSTGSAYSYPIFPKF